jgi:F0F1-type ATP synthase membrane subunit b/b'
MISIDWSIIPALIIFILTAVALNFLLFKPVTRIQEEREMRTSGLMSQTQQDLAHHLHLFDQYRATIKNARIEGYRLMEKARSEALLHRSAALEAAKRNAEQLTQQARDSIQAQVAEARAALELEALARRLCGARGRGDYAKENCNEILDRAVIEFISRECRGVPRSAYCSVGLRER